VPSCVSFYIVSLRVYIAADDVLVGANGLALLPRADEEVGFALLNTSIGRSGPNLKPGMVCVYGMNGLRKGMNTT